MSNFVSPLSEKIRSIPVIGSLLSIPFRVLHLGRAFARIEALETVNRGLEQRIEELEHYRRTQKEMVRDTLKSETHSIHGLIDHRFDNMRSLWRATLARNSQSLEHAIANQVAKPGRPDMERPDLAKDGIYLEFEDAFRGDWKVKERMAWYVPQVKSLFQTDVKRPILDVGCGRGEWLMALSDAGMPAVGIDVNASMIETSREKGLDVTLGDAVGHLRGMEAGTLAGVTAFHVMEHLPFEDILQFLEAAERALMPGGVLIVELPNPENLTVGACTFWYDPTHIKPIPPALMKFYVEKAGFVEAKIARFTLNMEGPDTATIDEPVVPSIDGPLDYSIIATKSAE